MGEGREEGRKERRKERKKERKKLTFKTNTQQLYQGKNITMRDSEAVAYWSLRCSNYNLTDNIFLVPKYTKHSTNILHRYE